MNENIDENVVYFAAGSCFVYHGQKDIGIKL